MFGLLEYSKEQKCFHFNSLRFFVSDPEDLDPLEKKYNSNGYYPLAIVRFEFIYSEYFDRLEKEAEKGASLEELAELATLLSLNDLSWLDKEDIQKIQEDAEFRRGCAKKESDD